MSATGFRLPTDDDEIDELVGLGVLLEAPCSDSDLDAYASQLLRVQGEAEGEVARYRAACAAEVGRIHERYLHLAEPHERRARQAEAMVCEAAKHADFGRKKSRAVGNGTYGRRTVPPWLGVDDPAALLAWAKREAPSLVRLVEKEDVPHKPLSQWFMTVGELPDGCSYEPEHETYFAKPALPEREGGHTND